MKASEILAGLAELLGGLDSGSNNQPPSVVVINNTPPTAPPAPMHQPDHQEPVVTPASTLTPVEPDNTDDSDKTTMVPPLQQKIELLKKSLNVDNEFSNGFDQIDQQQDAENPPDELERMKKMAGIKQTAQQELASDEPLDI
jgi:hypothetical protein